MLCALLLPPYRMDRLSDFHIDLLDGNQKEVKTIAHPYAVGASDTVTINDGTTARYVRIRFSLTKKQHLSLAEVEVIGYKDNGNAEPPAPVSVPAESPTVRIFFWFVVPLKIMSFPQDTLNLMLVLPFLSQPNPTSALIPPVPSPTIPKVVTNVALQKPATQTCDFSVYGANLAVDGNTNGKFSGGSIATTCKGSPGEWWMVDLEVEAFIESVVLYNRVDTANL